MNRDEIDSHKWDECISQSDQRIIYWLSWYLDIVAPGWHAYIKEENGKYTSVFPFALNKKFWITYIYQPPLTQQLGLFSIASENTKKSENLRNVLTKISEKYNYLNYNLNTDNFKNFAEFKEFNYLNKTTYHLDLNKDYPTLYNAYSENHKRNLKKSFANNLILKESNDISSLISIFKAEKGKELKNLKENVYLTLFSLYAEANKRNMSKLVFSEDPNGEIQAGALFLFYQNKIIYLFGASSKTGKQNSAMSMIFNEIIKTNSGYQGKILDFEGSDIETIARFYKGFGGEPVKYISLKLNTLPYLIKVLKR